MKDKITILLGAGFAQFVNGLSTKDINNIFTNYSKWMVGKDSLYVYLEKVFDKYYYDFNFETFLAIIENLFSYRLSQFRDEKTSTCWKNISSVLFDLKPEFLQCECLKNQETAYEVFRSYINLLNSSVERYDDTTKCEYEIIQFENYISCLGDSYNQIKIYSTNYDWIVPKTLKLCGANIGLCDDDYRQEFTYDLDNFRDLKLSYFPLHGCSYIYREPFDKVYLSSIVQSMPLWALSNNAGNPNTETLFTPIISGYSKLEHINGKPFNFGLQCFANDCYDSKLIVTMGYSYSDPHINSIIDTFCNCRIESVTLNDVPKFPSTLASKVYTNTNGIKSYL